MRKLIVLMQTTLDGRISNADGLLWQPSAWGEEETAYVNEAFARADTWAMSRKLYDVVVCRTGSRSRPAPPRTATSRTAPPVSSSPGSWAPCAR